MLILGKGPIIKESHEFKREVETNWLFFLLVKRDSTRISMKTNMQINLSWPPAISTPASFSKSLS